MCGVQGFLPARFRVGFARKCYGECADRSNLAAFAARQNLRHKVGFCRYFGAAQTYTVYGVVPRLNESPLGYRALFFDKKGRKKLSRWPIMA